MDKFIFGGNTGLAYEDLLKRREAARNIRQGQPAPNDFWSGLSAIGQAFIGRQARNKADKEIAARDKEFANTIDDAYRNKMNVAGKPMTEYGRNAANSVMDKLGIERPPSPSERFMNIIPRSRYSDEQRAFAKEMYDAEMASRTPEKTASIREYEYARQNGFEGSFNDYMNQTGASGSEYGVSPVYFTDDKGKLRIGQLSKDGGVQMLDNVGMTPVKPLQKVDTGTGTAMINSMTGGIEKTLSKNVGEAASEQAIGTATGKAEADAVIDYPRIQANADHMLSVIDQALNHPGLDDAVGNIQGNMPDWMRGMTSEKAANFIAISNQLQGKTFLEAYQSLKGGGQITEVEGKKAENAIARLTRTQSEDAYRQSLRDLRDVVKVGADRARNKAGAEPVPAKPVDKRTKDDILRQYGIKP